MAARALDTTSRASRPPRAMAWVLALASAAAVLLIGMVATALVFGALGTWPVPPATFWLRLGAACALTILSISLRSLRWIFLLRRAETRIPIRDAYIGYLAGLSLLFTPLLLGEIALRAYVQRRRGRVPFATTAVVNLWERLLDLTALALIGAVAALMTGAATPWVYVILAVVALTALAGVRRLLLRGAAIAATWVTRPFDAERPAGLDRLAFAGTWLTGLGTSTVAWLLPGMGLWILAAGWGRPYGFGAAEGAYASATALSGLALAPGGVLIAGPQMLASLEAHGIPGGAAALTVLGIRLATVGLSLALGAVFVVLHLRSAAMSGATHFDDIADAYDVQIPESRRMALLERKTALMAEELKARTFRRGLDVGCGQGAYVAEMRHRGFDVSGIDTSAGQVRLAVRNVGNPDLVRVGSVLEIPSPSELFDFVYTINVLHHLDSIDQQRQAFEELLRVLRPGGLLFIHEINTRNLLFRFYMGYVFPSLNCIDEGVERWLLPNHLARYTGARVAGVKYFTFLPDFVPPIVARVFAPVERMLESSPLRVFSAHYMAVLEKPPLNGR